MIGIYMDTYKELLRLKHAPDKDAEIAFQLKMILAKLEACGVVTENFEK